MARTITLKFPGTCRDCGSGLAVGALARWYGRGRIYGIGCHAKPGEADNGLFANDGLRWDSRLGRAIGANGMCEDAPACGCCGPNAG